MKLLNKHLLSLKASWAARIFAAVPAALVLLSFIYGAPARGAACPVDAAMIVYPAPQTACLEEAVSVPASLKFSVSSKEFTKKNLAKFKAVFAERGVSIEKAQYWNSQVKFVESEDVHKGSFRDEGYKIIVEQEPFGIKVEARSETGFIYAAETLKDLFPAGGRSIYTGYVDDFPAFVFRGVLEGGYAVWSHENRVSILKWLGSVKFNAFIYGPKEDPYFRRQWRRLYPPEILERFKTYLKICDENNVLFSYALSPAMSMEYSNPAEMDKLIAKYRQLQSIGVTRFGIFFDDILPFLSTPNDRKKFKSIAEGEVYVSNKLLQALLKKDPKASLFFVPNQYWGWTPTDYMKVIKGKLDPRIEVGWTGKDIVSEAITAEDAQKFKEVAGRKPAIGDNYSPMGPLVRRSPDLYKAADSFLNNPYSYTTDGNSDLSKLVNATIADYGWNPDAYDPERSFTMAARRLAGGEQAGDALMLELRLGNRSDVKSSPEVKLAELASSLENASPDGAVAAAGALKAEIEKWTAGILALDKANFNPILKKQLSDTLAGAHNKLTAASSAINGKTGADAVKAAGEVRKILGL